MTRVIEPVIEELPRGWTLCRIADVGAVQLGRQRSPSKVSNKFPTKYLRAANITWNGLKLDDILEMEFTPTERNTFQLKEGDILLSEASGSAGEVGKPAIWRGELDLCCFQNTVIRFRSHATEPRYALHLFSHFALSGVFVKASLGVGIHHLGAQRFSALSLPLPPIAEQARIADRLEELFSDLVAGVAALEQVRRKLKRYCSAVLHAAVTGRLTAAWRKRHKPPEETGRKLLARILVERHQQWETSTLTKYEQEGRQPPKNWRDRYPAPDTPKTDDLPELPKDWCRASTAQLCNGIENGNTPPPTAMTPGHGEIPFIKVYNLTKTGVLDFTVKPTFISTETHERLLKRSIVRPRDVLMNIVGPPLGKVSLVPDDYPQWNINQAIVAFHCSRGLVPEYLVLCLMADSVLSHLTSQAKASAGQYNISGSMCRELSLPIPPMAEQNQIVLVVQEKLSQIDAMEAEVERGLARARRLRQAILKSAFAGELVRQDPNDEPAAALMERIRAERESKLAEANGCTKRTTKKKTTTRHTAKRKQR